MAHLTDSCMPLVKNLLLLDAEGKRVAVKYFGDTWCAGARGRWPSRRRVRSPGGLLASRRACPVLLGRPNITAQTAFEKTLFTKTSRVNARGERAHPRAPRTRRLPVRGLSRP